MFSRPFRNNIMTKARKKKKKLDFWLMGDLTKLIMSSRNRPNIKCLKNSAMIKRFDFGGEDSKYKIRKSTDKAYLGNSYYEACQNQVNSFKEKGRASASCGEPSVGQSLMNRWAE